MEIKRKDTESSCKNLFVFVKQVCVIDMSVYG